MTQAGWGVPGFLAVPPLMVGWGAVGDRHQREDVLDPAVRETESPWLMQKKTRLKVRLAFKRVGVYSAPVRVLRLHSERSLLVQHVGTRPT